MSDNVELAAFAYYEEAGITIYNAHCADVLPHLSDIDFCLTDPPYGMTWQSNRRKVKYDHIQNDGELSWVAEVFSLIYASLKPDSLCMSFYSLLWMVAITVVARCAA